MKQRHAKHYARGWVYAHALMVAGLVGLGFWAGANVWIAANERAAWTTVEPMCGTDADCAARYPDIEYLIDAQTDVDQ